MKYIESEMICTICNQRGIHGTKKGEQEERA